MAVNLTFNSTEGVPLCHVLLREVLARESFSSNADKLSTIFVVGMDLVFMPFTILFNAFVIMNPVKYASFRRERLMVLCFLALTDFFSGLVCQPLYAAKEIYHLSYNQRNCGLESAFYHCSNISLLSSFFHLVLVTYERYVAILHPFKYPTHVTTPRLACCAVAIWIGAISISAVHYNYPFSEEELSYAQNATALVCFLALLSEVYCYIRIGLVIRKQRMRIDAQIRQQQRPHQYEQELQQRQLHRQEQQELQHARQQNQQRMRFQRRSSVSAGLLILCLIVAYLPFNISYGLASYYGDELRTSLFFSFLPWLEIMVLLNSFFNPIIYCLRTREFQENLHLLLR